MKIYNAFILLLIIFFTISSNGAIQVFTGGDPLPNEFTVDNDKSELITCPPGPYIFAFNGTSSIVEWGIGADTDTVPTAPGGQIPPNTPVDLQGYIEWSGNDAFFIRTYADSSITEGYFITQCGGHN